MAYKGPLPDLAWGGGIAISNYWRASVASETLIGVTQLKIGDVCLFIYVFGRTYVIKRVRVFSPKKTRLFRLDPSLF